MSEEKKPLPIEASLKYIAWDIKNIAAELKKLNEILQNFKQKDLF